MARIVLDGSFLCSGALVNTTEPSGTPLFLTANHCYATVQEINASVFYFNYESQTCNKGDDGEINHIVEGAIPIASHPDTDFELIQLNARVPSSYRPFFAGWARDGLVTNSTVIHHPLGFPKKISSSNNPATTNIDPLNFILPNFTTITLPPGHVWSIPFDEEVLQGGSSGAPLFNQDQRIVGQVVGGQPGCPDENPRFMRFGRFDISWWYVLYQSHG